MKKFDFYEFVETHRCFGSGTIKRGREKVAYYYKCEKVDMEKLKYDNAFVITFGPTYAPEIKHKAVFVLTDAEIKRAKENKAPLKEHMEKIKEQIYHTYI